jgi:hypothetical protein
MMGISNNNIGAAILLVFILLLTQSKVLDLFINTALGRIALIVFLLVISYMNKTLGVISVLSFILIANNSGWFILEGMENQTDDMTADAKDTAADTTDAKTMDAKATDDKKKDKMASPSANNTRSIEDIKNELAAAVAASAANEPDSEPAVTSEGFDVIGTERELQAGKCSNSIGVKKDSQDCDLVSPGEGNVFSNFFSVFN